MDTTIIVALITIAGTVCGNLIISARNTKDLFAKLDKDSELADQKLSGEMDTFRAEVKGELSVMRTEVAQLRAEVEKHNGVVERMAKMEVRVSQLEDRSA